MCVCVDTDAQCGSRLDTHSPWSLELMNRPNCCPGRPSSSSSSSSSRFQHPHKTLYLILSSQTHSLHFRVPNQTHTTHNTHTLTHTHTHTHTHSVSCHYADDQLLENQRQETISQFVCNKKCRWEQKCDFMFLYHLFNIWSLQTRGFILAPQHQTAVFLRVSTRAPGTVYNQKFVLQRVVERLLHLKVFIADGTEAEEEFNILPFYKYRDVSSDDCLVMYRLLQHHMWHSLLMRSDKNNCVTNVLICYWQRR